MCAYVLGDTQFTLVGRLNDFGRFTFKLAYETWAHYTLEPPRYPNAKKECSLSGMKSEAFASVYYRGIQYAQDSAILGQGVCQALPDFCSVRGAMPPPHGERNLHMLGPPQE